ncbi:uncharacterized protein LOC130749927 [Actinidia eriantha]|uniref:uncharacterized protein LOC130749927 n=1 Tax=Actinidia eriantha TaxID=165200 RepID=UPI0025857CCA|nr:uncharacterized protein LOC130749927 [Actinidia eriantha]
MAKNQASDEGSEWPTTKKGGKRATTKAEARAEQKKLLLLFLSKLDLPPPSRSSPPPPATSLPPADSSPPPIALAVVPPPSVTPAPSISSTKGHSAAVDSSAMNLPFDNGDGVGNGGYIDSYVAAADDVFTTELIGKDGFVESNGPILSSLAEMEVEEGFALREWRSDGIGVLRLRFGEVI